MFKVAVVVRITNEHGSSEEVIMSKEGTDTETVERELIQEFYVSGAQALCKTIYELEVPKAPIKAITERKRKPK